MKLYGFKPQTDSFEATIPGRKRALLQNVVFVVPGRSTETIVVMAHRDDSGRGAGANDNASGTAALMELARAYSTPQEPLQPSARSTRCCSCPPTAARSADSALHGSPSIRPTGATSWPSSTWIRSQATGAPGSRSAATRRARLRPPWSRRSPPGSRRRPAPARPDERARPADRPRLPLQLLRAGPLVGRGIPAVTLTTGGDRPPPAFGDTPERLDRKRLTEIGRAAQGVVGSLDEGLELAAGRAATSTSARGSSAAGRSSSLCWRCCCRSSWPPSISSRAAGGGGFRWRRRSTPTGAGSASGSGPGRCSSSSRSSGSGPAEPRGRSTRRRGRPETGPCSACCSCSCSRCRPGSSRAHGCRPRRPPTAEEELAGHTGRDARARRRRAPRRRDEPVRAPVPAPGAPHLALAAPRARPRPGARLALVAAGLVGPFILVGSFMFRFGLGLDAPWYLAELVAINYVSIVAFVLVLCCLAAAAQLTAIAAGATRRTRAPPSGRRSARSGTPSAPSSSGSRRGGAHRRTSKALEL